MLIYVTFLHIYSNCRCGTFFIKFIRILYLQSLNDDYIDFLLVVQLHFPQKILRNFLELFHQDYQYMVVMKKFLIFSENYKKIMHHLKFFLYLLHLSQTDFFTLFSKFFLFFKKWTKIHCPFFLIDDFFLKFFFFFKFVILLHIFYNYML